MRSNNGRKHRRNDLPRYGIDLILNGSAPKSPGLAARKMRLLGGVLFGTSLLACGCRTSPVEWWNNCFKVGPNYVRPAEPLAGDWIDPAESGIKRDQVLDSSWWNVFEDPILSAFIQTAARENLDLQTAGTRIINAAAERNIAFGNLFPQSQTVTAGDVHAQIPRNLGVPFLPNTVNVADVGFNASWEVDFWGRYRRSLEAAEGEYEASVEDYGDTLVILLANVATTYVQLRTVEQRLEFARKNVAIQEGTLQLVILRHQEGVTTELDLVQAESNLAQTQALIPPLIAGRRQASNQLCVLLGMPASDIDSQLQSASIPQAPVEIAVGIPADLLRRRPDVRRAERRLAAQSARIGVAEADLYPRLAVQGFIGYAASDLPNLLSPGSVLGIIFPTLQWNLLNYGRISNNIRGQEAQLAGASLTYQQSVLNAGQEVEDGLVAFLQARQQAERLEKSVKAAERAVELVDTQYRAGVVDFNRVYNTQSLLVSQQDQLATSRGNIATSLIRVYKALGGGWEMFSQGEPVAGPVISTTNDPLPSPNPN